MKSKSTLPRFFDLASEPDPDLFKSARALLKVRPLEALKELEELARLGSPAAMLIIGDCLRFGSIYEQNLDLAEQWYSAAAELGFIPAVHGLGMVYWKREEYNRAVEEFERSVSQGYSPSMNVLGGMYLFGQGVKQDLTKARILLERGSALGNLYARSNLGHALLRGRYGILNIPRGFLLLFSFLWSVPQVKFFDPYGDRMR